MMTNVEMMNENVRAMLGARFLAQLLGFEGAAGKSMSEPILDEQGNSELTAARATDRLCESWQDLRKQWKAEAAQHANFAPVS